MSNPENKEIQQDWNKLERVALKVGLREGLSDGRDSIYQKSFDEGYQIGYENGFLLAKHKAQLLIQSKEPLNLTKMNELLGDPRKGLCQMCKDENFTKKPIKKHKENQKELLYNTVKELKNYY